MAPSSTTPPARPQRRPSGRRGFALLITITLLAFLVLLLVSLASLTRVETQVAANTQQLTQARQNALLALNIALGQLQKYAGPDQRTTAQADLQNTPGQTNTHWTGVYGSSVVADYTANPVTIATDLTTTANIDANGSPARLLNWLVSGNEPAAFDPAWSTGSVGSAGQITSYPDPASTTAIPFKPTGTVTGLTATTPATSTTIQITNAAGTPKDARLLVGPATVTSSTNSSGAPTDYVVAPLVPIQTSASQVPGQGGTSPVTIGRYAWWVGDEGVKARVNLPLAGTDPALSASDQFIQQRNAFANSTRAAVELMASDTPGWSSTPSPLTANRIGTLYNPAKSVVSGILSTGQTALASTNSVAMTTALKYRYHDLTAQSSTVLSDTYAGGLKRDLSILLDSSFHPKSSDPTANATRLWVLHPGDTGSFDPSTGSATGTGFEVPTWQHLRSYAQTRIPTTGGTKLSLPARLPANDKSGYTDDVGVGPVITYFSIGFRAAPAGAPAAGVGINMDIYPLVVIWNPYTFTLKAPAPQADGSTYEVGIYPTYNVMVGLEKLVPVAGSSPPATTPTRIASFDFQKDTDSINSNGTEYIRFRLKCPDIPPGQSLIFSLPVSGSGKAYNQLNILENIEPEPSTYVTIPFMTGTPAAPLTIQPGEETLDYQLNKVVSGTNNLTSSFWNGGGGGMFTYIGAPIGTAANPSRIPTGGGTTTASRLTENPSNPARSWYNAHQSIGWDINVASNPLQGPAQLNYDNEANGTSEPSYVFLTQALFSGQGNNAQLDSNQFMFPTRWIGQGNMRATRSGRTRRDENYNVLFTATTGSPSLKVLWQKFINDEGASSNRTSAGQGHDWINGAPVDATLFEFPYDDQPIQSIGQLQHANLSLIGDYPSYPIGNSLADFRLYGSGTYFPAPPPAGYQLARVDKATNASLSELGNDMVGYYDISYLLNRTLWDHYYFSTVPATGTIPVTLPNPRLTPYNNPSSATLQDVNLSASRLMLAGGFNINSTSEQAWRAILGGANQVAFNPLSPESPSSTALPVTFPRFTHPTTSTTDPSGTDPNAAWQGYRTLTGDQIAQLARNIVAEIRARGPFVSLADFINRRLVDNPATSSEDETYRGTLQAAIDGTSTAQFPANDPSDTFWTKDSLITSSSSTVNQTTQYTDGYYSRPLVEGRFNSTTTAAKTYGNRSAFAPKYITQADILSTIGANLAGRSDTFTIRTYGETVNPALSSTDAGYITGRAWCEAVVQRLPAYVDQTDPALTTSTDTTVFPAGVTATGLGNATAPSKTNATNQAFGRQFKIISFRWLSPTDI